MSAFDVIVAAFHEAGLVVRGNTRAQVRAQCPAHGSRGLTVSIRRGEDRARVHCFAGCDGPDVLAAVGLGLRDLYDQPGRRTDPPTTPRVPTAWEEAMAELGIHHPPPIEHVLRRMEVEAIKEGRSP